MVVTCSEIKGEGVTTALVARAELGTHENPMPQTHPVADASTKTQANVAQLHGLEGIGTSYRITATASRSAVRQVLGLVQLVGGQQDRLRARHASTCFP